jgi:hypothetical protein
MRVAIAELRFATFKGNRFMQVKQGMVQVESNNK